MILLMFSGVTHISLKLIFLFCTARFTGDSVLQHVRAKNGVNLSTRWNHTSHVLEKFTGIFFILKINVIEISQNYLSLCID